MITMWVSLFHLGEKSMTESGAGGSSNWTNFWHIFFGRQVNLLNFLSKF